MSAALDFRKCKRLLLSSLAVSPGTGVHIAKQRHGFCRAKSPLRNKKRTAYAVPFLVEMRGVDKALFFGKLLYNKILYNVPYRQENMAQIWHKLLTKRLLRFALPG